MVQVLVLLLACVLLGFLLENSIMRTVSGIPKRVCQGCGNSRAKLQRVPQADVFSLYSKGICLIDRVNEKVCSKCAENISPETFQFTRPTTLEDTQLFVQKNMCNQLTKDNNSATTSAEMSDESHTPNKRHSSRSTEGRFQKKPKTETVSSDDDDYVHYDRKEPQDKAEEKQFIYDLDELTEQQCVSLFGLKAEDVRDFSSRLSFPEAKTKPYKLTPLQQTQLFLTWMRLGNPQEVIGVHFNVAQSTVTTVVERVLKLCKESFIPSHVGFGPLHNLTSERIKNDLSTWISREISNNILDADVLAVADGTYIYCMSVGSFEGNKMLYSVHKKRCLLKVMVLVSTRGYILDVWTGYGGSGKCNDTSLWKDILKKDTEFKDFCDRNDIGFVVDRGFGVANDGSGTGEELGLKMFAPRMGKKLSEEDANYSRFVTKIRQIVERINQVAIKKWRLLSAVLHWEYIKYIDELIKVASALWNCYHGCLDEERYENDNTDFTRMMERYDHENRIPDLLEKTKFSGAKYDADLLPQITDRMIREWSFGDYAIGLSERYVRHSAKALAEKDKDFHFLAAAKDLGDDLLLVKVVGMKSRFKNSEGRTVYVLFCCGAIEDTLCNCGSGKRTVGGCAHGVAFLRIIKKQKAGELDKYVALKSDSVFDTLTIPDFVDDHVTESDNEMDDE